MKRSNFIFESVLMVITFVLGVLALLDYINRSPDGLSFIFLLWLIPLGILQLVHSFVLVNAYWEHPSVKEYLTIYYIGVLFDFVLLFIAFGFLQTNAILLLSVVIIPVALATLLWYITYLFKNIALAGIEEKQPGDLF